MRRICLRPGDRVHVVERKGEEFEVHQALAGRLSMDEALAGEHGEPSIRAVFVQPNDEVGMDGDLRNFDDVVHVSHKDWREGRAGLAWIEAGLVRGMCRYCGCTEACACPEGCMWLPGTDQTVCSAAKCAERFDSDFLMPLAERMAEAAG